MGEWIEEGQKAPDFELKADDGSAVKLSQLRGSPVVLYFYPKDDTPGCTKEACSFRDRRRELEKLGVKVLGKASRHRKKKIRSMKPLLIRVMPGVWRSI
jgi:peroxiredoxin Q/BCP